MHCGIRKIIISWSTHNLKEKQQQSMSVITKTFFIADGTESCIVVILVLWVQAVLYRTWWFLVSSIDYHIFAHWAWMQPVNQEKPTRICGGPQHTVHHQLYCHIPLSEFHRSGKIQWQRAPPVVIEKGLQQRNHTFSLTQSMAIGRDW